MKDRTGPEDHPVTNVKWVPVELVKPNLYNPNSVPPAEMALLKTSIMADGYTMPAVVMDNGDGTYVLIDGFHRWLSAQDPDIRATTGGMIPVSVVDAPLEERMASTVRHNRARGAHAIMSMGNIAQEMMNAGWTDERILLELGMSADELERLKHVTGYAKLYSDRKEYSQAWLPSGWKQHMDKRAVEKRMVEARRERKETVAAEA